MRGFVTATIVSLCIGLCVTPSLAQDDSTTYIFSEYYICDQNREAFADSITEHALGPIYDKYVAAGDLTGWSLLSHNAGGHWRRLLYYSSTSIDKLLETRAKMIEEFEAMGDETREFTSICPEHDDLVWSSVASSPAAASPPETPPRAAYSTYYICDVTRQERADEIVQQLIGPAADKLVASGELAGWSWNAHVIGGRYRRLMAHRGTSHAGLIAAVTKYNEAASATNEALANEFSEICNSHVDYLWDVVLPKPPSAE